MTALAIALVLLSALLHASWNLLSKDSRDRWGFFLAQGVTALAFWLPLLVLLRPTAPIAAVGWICIAASGLIHAGYAAALLKSYEAGDLSVAYPLGRIAPVLLVVWDLFTAPASLSLGGVVGATLAGVGALTLQWPELRRRGVRGVLRAGVTRYAFLTALTIAAYTIVDHRGVQSVAPFAYLYGIMALEFVLMVGIVGRGGATRLREELRRNGRAVWFTAVTGPLSYWLTLWAFTFAPSSYVLGLRQSSIVFGVILGRIFLGEGETAYRSAGALIIAIGGALIVATG